MSLALGAFMLWFALAGTACADEVAGDDRGALLAATCSGCHRPGLSSADGIPGFEGRSSAEIVQKLSAYKGGKLRGTLMNRIARGYTQADIVLLGNALGSPSE